MSRIIRKYILLAGIVGLIYSVTGINGSATEEEETQVSIVTVAGAMHLPAGKAEDSIQYVVFDSVSLGITLTGVDCKTIAYAVPNYVTALGPILSKPASPPASPFPDVDNIFVLTFPDEATRDASMSALENESTILVCEKIVHGANDSGIIPNDPQFNLQWGLHNTGQAGGYTDKDINAPEAWSITTGDSSVILAIIDGGVLATHPDLSGRIMHNDVRLIDQHGTQVAGVMGAATNNDLGLAGVDWKAKLWCGEARYDDPKKDGNYDFGKVFDDFVAAVGAGAVAVNISWSYYNEDFTLRTAIAYAYNSNVAVVASSGNNVNDHPRYPAANLNVMAVGSMTNTGYKSWWSSYGSHLDLVAPGGQHPAWPWDSTNEKDIRLLHYLPGSQTPSYHYYAGTSYAAPAVVGTIGLLHARQPDLYNDDVRNIICLTAKDIPFYGPGFDVETGYGLLRADAALKILKPPSVLRHYTASTPIVESVSDWTNMSFVCAPDLPDGIYLAKKYTLIQHFDFDKEFLMVPHAWGCGAGTNGWSAANPNFGGLQYCRIDSNSISTSGCATRCFVYELINSAGGYVGYRPCAPQNVSMTVSALGEEVITSPVMGADLDDPATVVVHWSDPNNNEEGQTFYRKVNSGVWEAIELEPNITSKECADTLASTYYHYKVRPYTGNQGSVFSNTKTIKHPPRQPENCEATVEYIDPSHLSKETLGKATTEDPNEPVLSNLVSFDWDQSARQPDGTVENWIIEQRDIHCYWVLMPSGANIWACDTVWEVIHEAPAEETSATLCFERNKDYVMRIRTVDIYGDTNVNCNDCNTLPFTTGSYWGCSEFIPVCDKPAVPDMYMLSQNRPNPFNASTIIEFGLPVEGNVRLEIYDVLGRRVRRLVDDFMPAGYHNVTWNGRDDGGIILASGMYFYRLTAGEFTESKKMILMK